jgi:flagellar export protein FliJ
MKPFAFSLQSIRVLREQKEQAAQQRFGQALRACEEAARALQLASDALAEGWNALCQELKAGVTATKLARTRAWCEVLESRHKERSAALEEARRAMDAASSLMLSAMRDRQALDRFHDRCRAQYDRELRRHDQKTLDELGLRPALSAGPLAGKRHRRTTL